MFDHFTFGPLVKARTPGRDKDSQVGPKDEPNPASLSHSEESQWQTYKPASESTPDDTIGNKLESQSDMGGNSSIDIITHRLSNSHLRKDVYHHPPPLSRGSTSTCSSVSSYYPPNAPRLENDCHYRQSSLSMGSRRGTATNISSVMASSTVSPLEEDPAESSPHHRQDIEHLRPQKSSQFNNVPPNTRAIQTLVEEMVSTGSQCNVYTPPLAPTCPAEVDGTNEMDYEMGPAGLEVDENSGDDAKYESPSIEKFLSLRRAAGTTGIRKGGFLLHQSSTDTALRSQHLVKNRPRMRKRPKLK